jgi:hypothetical protein
VTNRLVLASLSGAMDGGLTAIAEVAEILAGAGKLTESRLIGGVAVLLHQQRLSIDLPLRATGDADFGVPPYLLREPELVAAIEERGYRKVLGNRWERPIDATRVARAPSAKRESRDAEDLWRCLEIALADGVTAETLNDDATLAQIVPILRRELGPGGASLDVITAGVTDAEGARRRTRIRALLAAVAAITE